MPKEFFFHQFHKGRLTFLLGCRHADNKIQPSSDPASAAWSCENPTTLGDLKHRLNFTGWVMSDW